MWGKQREGKSTPGREEDRGEARRQGILSPLLEQAAAGIISAWGDEGSSTKQLHSSQEEDKVHFARSPLEFGDFLEILKIALIFARFGDLNLFKNL
jgi:hypothetical protein